MRIALATDAWSPQTNGVVRTLSITVAELERAGPRRRRRPSRGLQDRALSDVSGDSPCRSAVPRAREAARRFSPEAVHIATEGPLGLAARRWCRRRRRPFTTSYHTQFPEYVRARAPIPAGADLRAPSTVSRHRRAHARRHAIDAAAVGAARVPQPRALESWRRYRSFPSARQGAPRPAAADLDLFRARGDREGYRGFPRRSTCPAASWWWVTVRQRASLRQRFPAAHFAGYAVRRGARAPLLVRGRLRVSQPHGYLRSRAARGDGLRRARRRVSGDRSASTWSRRRDRRVERRP